jgi:thioredoxin-related protein
VARVRAWVGDRAHVVSVATSYQHVGQVQGFVNDQKLEYPVLLGGENELRRFQVNAFPTLYFLDEQGRVKAHAVGYTTTVGLLFRLLF